MEAAEELHSKNVSRKITEKAKWWVIVAHQHFSSVKNIWKSYIWTADKDVNEMIHDQLPVGLLAQLVERCTGIAEVMGSNPIQAWIFFQALFSLLPK